MSSDSAWSDDDVDSRAGRAGRQPLAGTRVLRTEDHLLLTDGGIYTADLKEPLLAGAASVVFVRSNLAHGRIRSIQTAEALQCDGVLAVVTSSDLGLEGTTPPDFPGLWPEAMGRPFLATEAVRFVGEPLAAVVAESMAQAVDAAELVWADIEELPVVIGTMDAESDETLLFPEVGTNVAARMGEKSDSDILSGCEVVVRGELHHQRLAGCPLEGRAAAAVWQDGNLSVWISSQAVHGAHRRYQAIYGLEPDGVRVVAPDVGGGFGPKIHTYAEELLLPQLARIVERPVRWVETRSENMVAMGHGRAQTHTFEIGGSRDGRIQAYRLNVVADSGAYPALGTFLPKYSCMMAPGNYDIERVEVEARAVVTNTMSTVAYRGAGRPEATLSIERAVDLFAAELGLDPVEVRRTNLISADEFPFTTATGVVYDSGDYQAALDRALEAAGYSELRLEQARWREAGDSLQIGIGVSCYVEITAGPVAGRETGEVRVRPDGTVVVLTGASAHGQGHHTAFAMLVADLTGVDLDCIEVVHGDTALIPRGTGTFGSRSLQLGGAAVYEAAAAIVDAARAVAAELLAREPDQVTLDTTYGCFVGVGEPARTVSWADVARAVDPEAGLSSATTFKAEHPTFPFGAHVAVVEVDTETGEVRLVKHVACDDAGRILNPVLAEGQRHGGIAQGAAQVLCEGFVYDGAGNPLTTNLADYGCVSATELPTFHLVDMETVTDANPMGAKGIGESGTIGATPAVLNAIIDALSPFGVREIEMPVTPERVWRALVDAEDSASATQGGSR